MNVRTLGKRIHQELRIRDRGPTLSNTLFLDIIIWQLLVGIFLHIISHPLDINHDCAALLQSGQLLLDGKLPYVDFVSTNPPFALYLNAIPAGLARLFPLHVALVFSLSVLVLVGWSTLTIRRIMSYSTAKFDERTLRMIVLLFAALSLMLLLRKEFGQREHLFVLLYFPFFVTRYVRSDGRRISLLTAITTGIAAAVGACIKPHFVAIALFVELYWVISKRDIRKFISIEMVFFVCTGLLYALHFAFLPDVVKSEFFGRWLPFVAQRYSVYNEPFSQLVSMRSFFGFAVAALPLAFLTPVRERGLARMTRPLGVFAFGSIGAFLLQHKLWDYHLIPAIYGAVLILGISVNESANHFFRKEAKVSNICTFWLTAQAVAILAGVIAVLHRHLWLLLKWGDLTLLVLIVCFGISLVCFRMYVCGIMEPWTSCRRRSVVRYLVLALVGVSAVAFGLYPWHDSGPLEGNPLAETISKHTREGDPVLIASTSVGHPYPILVQMNRRPGSRYLDLATVAMLYRDVEAGADGVFPYRVGEEAPEEEVRFLAEFAEDIRTIRPRLIFVFDGGRHQGCPEGFVLIDYLTKTGFIETAMHHYVELPRVSACKVFLLRHGKSLDLRAPRQ